ncbi:Uncharacterized membrane protein [Clostridium collagenovorans DSM 3089]|uniref:Uncharacterized membrane protein n=1 Tax=Clostridium collagenovorans DSM 3089 TaxID=1121306 RepID=A0A1M5T812_9CLOT|nr:DUF1622 domain-containing protein [Clostridium collagenovorans]SHH46828.1 Uncharacterized membrane protein [Clostridium collagenovorans DSM 3089]
MEEVISKFVPIIVHILEIMGIIVLTIGAFKAFFHYIKGLFFMDSYAIKYQFANSMAMALEFKLSAEILKTVLIRSLNEILILGSIFLLRALMTLVIQREMKEDMELRKNSNGKNPI